MIIDLFSILPLTCTLFVVLFGLFIFFKDPSSRMNQLLAGFSLCMAMWLWGTFMMFAFRSEPVTALFWDRFVYSGVVLMPPLMHYFSLLFTQKIKQQRVLLSINCCAAFFFFFATWTNYFVEGVYTYSWGVHSQARLLHHFFLGWFFIATGLFFYNIWTYFRKLKDKELKIQAVYVFLAFATVIFIGGTAYLYAYNIDTRFPFGYFSGLIFPIMLFYAVSKHHLLGAKVVATEVLVGATDFVLVIQIFLANSFVEVVLRSLFAIAIIIIGVLLIRSVKKEVQRREQLSLLAESLEKANLRLQELDRQKTEFLSIASHQLRTPLSIIGGFVELLEDGAYGKMKTDAMKVLHDMDDTNSRLVKLVDEFLNITRIEQGRAKFTFVSHDLNEVISSVVKELMPRAGQKKMKINWHARGPLTFKFDDDKIRHVVFNFIDNAIKYSDQGSVMVRVEKDEQGVSFKVIDEGIGFGKEDQASFFQKFYRGKNVEGINVTGTGIGLYICSKFISAHGGRVWAKSKGIGKGSEFGFWIPLDPPPQPEEVSTGPVTVDQIV